MSLGLALMPWFVSHYFRKFYNQPFIVPICLNKTAQGQVPHLANVQNTYTLVVFCMISYAYFIIFLARTNKLRDPTCLEKKTHKNSMQPRFKMPVNRRENYDTCYLATHFKTLPNPSPRSLGVNAYPVTTNRRAPEWASPRLLVRRGRKHPLLPLLW